MEIGVQEHKFLATWAAGCAEHVLPLFERIHPADDRPRKAIEAAHAWVRGEIRVSRARSFAFDAHAAAREAATKESKAVARAAGHAAATAHVAKHAKYAASYAAKAAFNPPSERDWQLQHLPKHFHMFMQ